MDDSTWASSRFHYLINVFRIMFGSSLFGLYLQWRSNLWLKLLFKVFGSSGNGKLAVQVGACFPAEQGHDCCSAAHRRDGQVLSSIRIVWTVPPVEADKVGNQHWLKALLKGKHQRHHQDLAEQGEGQHLTGLQCSSTYAAEQPWVHLLATPCCKP